MRHYLKCAPPFFDDVVDGRKKIEVRKNDRDYKLHDTLVLLEFAELKYTGRESAELLVTHVLTGWGVQDGYVAMSVEEIMK